VRTHPTHLVDYVKLLHRTVSGVLSVRVAEWCSGYSAVVLIINEVALHRARLLLGWVTVCPVTSTYLNLSPTAKNILVSLCHFPTLSDKTKLSWTPKWLFDRPTPQRHWICSCQPLETDRQAILWDYDGAMRRPGDAMTTTTTLVNSWVRQLQSAAHHAAVKQDVLWPCYGRRRHYKLCLYATMSENFSSDCLPHSNLLMTSFTN